MIVDLEKERLPKTIHKSVCIVGTGIGGGSFITRYLKEKGDIVVIEAGGERENTAIRMEPAGRDFGIVTTREISIGGTSNIWRGLCSPIDRMDCLVRNWIDGSGWPIDPEEIQQYYLKAIKMLGLPEFSYFKSGEIDQNIEDLAYDIPINRKMLTNKYFVLKRPPKNFRHDILDQFKIGNKLLILNGVAVEVITNDKGNHIEKVLAKDPRGESIEIFAKNFVIASGALETPRLLLNSRRWNNRGVGNNFRMVGCFLMDHPMGSLSQIKLHKIQKAPLYNLFNLGPNKYIKTGLVLREELQKQYQLPNHCFYLWPSFKQGIDDRFENLKRTLITARKKSLKMSDIMTLMSNPNTIYRVLSLLFPIGAYYKYADLFFVTEQIPNRNSSVSLSYEKDEFGYPIAKINWYLTKADLESIAAYNELVLKALLRNTSSVSFQKNKEQINESLTSAAHHMGTARMGTDERSSVVDRNLKVWGLDNLYICDASVFPTSGNSNPSLTICALAIRLADMLLENQ
jgi:hypothetical protein